MNNSPGRDFCLQLEWARLPDIAGVKVASDLLEQRLELVEVLALLAVGDFLCRALIGSGAHMA